jgi:hypothetical protein
VGYFYFLHLQKEWTAERKRIEKRLLFAKRYGGGEKTLASVLAERLAQDPSLPSVDLSRV